MLPYLLLLGEQNSSNFLSCDDFFATASDLLHIISSTDTNFVLKKLPTVRPAIFTILLEKCINFSYFTKIIILECLIFSVQENQFAFKALHSTIQHQLRLHANWMNFLNNIHETVAHILNRIRRCLDRGSSIQTRNTLRIDYLKY